MERLSDLRANLRDVQDTEFVGGVYPRRQLSILASPPGLGKTWITIRQCMDIASGSLMFGGSIKDAPQKAVLFCGESGVSIIAERLRCMDYDLGTLPSGFVVYTHNDFVKHHVDICLDHPDGMSNFQKIVEGEKPSLVFIDTLISFRDVDESAVQETAKLLGSLRALADKVNCAIVVNHHTRKRKLRDRYTEGTQDEIIGTSAFSRLCALAMMLSDTTQERTIRYHCVKSWFEKPDDFYFRIDSDVYGQVRLVQCDTLRFSDARREVRRYVEGLHQGDMIDSVQVATTYRVGRYLARRILASLADEGLIQESRMMGDARTKVFLRV